MTTIPIYEGGIFTTEAVTVASLLTEAITTITSAVGATWDLITSNPVLCLFVGCSILSLGFGFLRKAKRAAR